MDGATNVFIAFIVIGIPMIVLGFLFTRWFRLKEKKLDVEANLAVEKAAQYAASNAELEARVRILEKIVTDGGAHTAAQIEALREMPEPATVSATAAREPSNG
jgi:hypothetical protein